MSNSSRLPGESNIDYIIRLAGDKINGISLLSYADFFSLAFGKNFSEDEARKRFYGIAMMLDEIDTQQFTNIDEESMLNELENKRREMVKERVRLSDHRSAYNKELREQARWEELKDIVRDEVNKLTPYPEAKPQILPSSDNDLLIGLNDIHFGVEIDNHWNKYNPEIAKERLTQYLSEIATIQKLHKSENCYVLANGDLISGNIHYQIALANRENVIKQVMGVSELFAWFLSELAKMFSKVNFCEVDGNHSRLSPNKDMSPKGERLDALIPFYLKARLQNFKNISILEDRIDDTMSMVTIRGKNYASVHGDYDGIKQILRLIEMYEDKDIYAVFMGHLHHNTVDSIQGYKILMSGSLMGMDDYCVEKRIKGKPEQLVCVCTSNGVRCSYDVVFS